MDVYLYPPIELKGQSRPYPPFTDLDSFGGFMSTKLHVGNISSTVLEDDLKARLANSVQSITLDLGLKGYHPLD